MAIPLIRYFNINAFKCRKMKRDAIDFENDNIGKLFRRLLIPTLFGTIAVSAMTAIDGIVIGHGVGASGVAAVNIIVPIYQLVSGLTLMVGTGCSVVASIHFSKKKVKAARLNLSQAIAATTLAVAILCTFMFCFTEETALFLGASPTLLPQVCDYLLWMLPGFLCEVWTMIGLFIIRLDGSPKYAMWCNVLPAISNGILDYVFVIPLGMGVKGAAIATSMSMGIGALMTMAYMLFLAKDLRLIRLKLSRKSMMLSLRNIVYQCRIGSSSMFGELTLAVLIFIGNLVFARFKGDDGVGAFGIACYYMPFFFMIGNSVAQSAQPIISFNFGIGYHKRVRQAMQLLFLTSAGLGVVVTLIFIFAPQWLVGLFVSTTSRAGELAIQGFPLLAVGVVFFIVNVAIIGYYQSIERMKYATLLVFLRGFLFLVPSYLILPVIIGFNGAWLAMPLTEVLTFCFALLLRYVKK